MVKFRYTIADPNGVHARPAGLLVREAQKFPCAVTLACGEKRADLKRLFAVLSLDIKHGETVEVAVEGDGEAEAAGALERFFRQNF